MDNVKLLQAMLKDMSKDNVDLDTMNTGLLTSIATSLAIVADHIQTGGDKNAFEEEQTSGSGTEQTAKAGQ